METQNRKYVLDIFSEKLRRRFETFCREHRQNTSLENFITYLIDQDLITPGAIKHYAIVETFNELYSSKKEQKTNIVNTLADRFNLTPRSIWNALRKNRYITNSPNRLKIVSGAHKL